MSTQNEKIVQFVQASLGCISENFRAVSFSCFPTHYVFHFVLSEKTTETTEDIDDIVAEFAALETKHVRIEVDVSVRVDKLDLSTIPGHLVFLRKTGL